MSVADAIYTRLKHIRKGKPFSRVVFAPFGSRAAVDSALSRLVKSGSLERVARGIYMRPKFSKDTQYARVLRHAVNAFGNQKAAQEWLGRPCRYLNGDVPQDVIDNPIRFQAIEDYLERIAYGVYQ